MAEIVIQKIVPFLTKEPIERGQELLKFELLN